MPDGGSVAYHVTTITCCSATKYAMALSCGIARMARVTISPSLRSSVARVVSLQMIVLASLKRVLQSNEGVSASTGAMIAVKAIHNGTRANRTKSRRTLMATFAKGGELSLIHI